jgi:hypothetical protein
MRFAVLAGLLATGLSGCNGLGPATTSPRVDGLDQMVATFMTGYQQMIAQKMAEGIAAEGGGLLPLRIQAVALSLVTFRSEKKSWPSDKEELRSYITKILEKELSTDEFERLTLQPTSEQEIVFSFGPGESKFEQCRVTADGTVSFSIPVAPAPKAAVVQRPAEPRPNEFPWGELIARLIVELALRSAAGKK